MVVLDKRELIVVRLVTLLADITGIKGVFRDRADLPESDKPGIIVLDGKEELRTRIQGYSFVGMPPAVFTLTPQIWVLLRMRDNMDNQMLDGVLNPVGPELSAFRNAVINLIANDDTLQALVSPNGQIEYRGCDTDMQSGSTMGSDGAMEHLHFAFSYPLDPADLLGATGI